MIIVLKKKLKRIVKRLSRGRDWVVTLDPESESINIREKGLHHEGYDFDIGALYFRAAYLAAEEKRAKKKGNSQ